MRTKYALVNGLLSLLIFSINGVMTFILRKLMLPILGNDIVGLTTTFTDILAFLNLADMGFSASIGASLYKPIYEQDYALIKGILNLFKKIYRFCGLIYTGTASIITIGMFIFFKNPNISSKNAAFYFFLTAATTGLSYFFSYRLILLSTDQSMFSLKLVNVGTRMIATILKIFLLNYYKSFALYLLVDFIFNFLYFIIMNSLIKKRYRKMENSVAALSGDTRSKIFKTVKGLTIHQIAGFALSGTNNLYTAIFAGLSSAALLSNYQMVVTLMNGIIGNFYAGLSSSIGNLIASEEPEKRYQIFRVIFFATSMITMIGTITFINSAQTFICAFFGAKYLMSKTIVYLLAAYFLIYAIRPATEQFKNSAGIFYEDRFVPLVEACINVAACVLLGSRFGAVGVVGGNIISTVCIVSWQKPYMTFKYIFHRRLSYYFVDLFQYIVSGIICYAISALVCSHVSFKNGWITFFSQVNVSILICTTLFTLIFYKTNRFQELIRSAHKFTHIKVNKVRDSAA